jgi:hypothetical protein
VLLLLPKPKLSQFARSFRTEPLSFWLHVENAKVSFTNSVKIVTAEKVGSETTTYVRNIDGNFWFGGSQQFRRAKSVIA